MTMQRRMRHPLDIHRHRQHGLPVDNVRLKKREQLAGKLNLDDLMSRHIRLDQVNEGFESMKAGEVARSVILFDD